MNHKMIVLLCTAVFMLLSHGPLSHFSSSSLVLAQEFPTPEDASDIGSREIFDWDHDEVLPKRLTQRETFEDSVQKGVAVSPGPPPKCDGTTCMFIDDNNQCLYSCEIGVMAGRFTWGTWSWGPNGERDKCISPSDSGDPQYFKDLPIINSRKPICTGNECRIDPFGCILQCSWGVVWYGWNEKHCKSSKKRASLLAEPLHKVRAIGGDIETKVTATKNILKRVEQATPTPDAWRSEFLPKCVGKKCDVYKYFCIRKCPTGQLGGELVFGQQNNDDCIRGNAQPSFPIDNPPAKMGTPFCTRNSCFINSEACILFCNEKQMWWSQSNKCKRKIRRDELLDGPESYISSNTTVVPAAIETGKAVINDVQIQAVRSALVARTDCLNDYCSIREDTCNESCEINQPGGTLRFGDKANNKKCLGFVKYPNSFKEQSKRPPISYWTCKGQSCRLSPNQCFTKCAKDWFQFEDCADVGNSKTSGDKLLSVAQKDEFLEDRSSIDTSFIVASASSISPRADLSICADEFCQLARGRCVESCQTGNVGGALKIAYQGKKCAKWDLWPSKFLDADGRRDPKVRLPDWTCDPTGTLCTMNNDKCFLKCTKLWFEVGYGAQCQKNVKRMTSADPIEDSVADVADAESLQARDQIDPIVVVSKELDPQSFVAGRSLESGLKCTGDHRCYLQPGFCIETCTLWQLGGAFTFGRKLGFGTICRDPDTDESKELDSTIFPDPICNGKFCQVDPSACLISCGESEMVFGRHPNCQPQSQEPEHVESKVDHGPHARDLSLTNGLIVKKSLGGKADPGEWVMKALIAGWAGLLTIMGM